MRSLEQAHAIMRAEGCGDLIGLGEEALGVSEAEQNAWLRSATEEDLRDWCSNMREQTEPNRLHLEAEFRAALRGLPALSRVLCLLVALLVLPGCAGSFEMSRGAEAPWAMRARCKAIDESRRGWANLATVLTVGTGIDAGAALAIEDKDGRTVALVTAAVGAVVALVAGAAAEWQARDWARDCSGRKP